VAYGWGSAVEWRTCNGFALQRTPGPLPGSDVPTAVLEGVVVSLSSVSSAVLTAQSISKSFALRTVLDRVSVTVGPDQRIGVVGPNGAGKSTLLKILAGVEDPSSGLVKRSNSTTTVGYLPQETTVESDIPLMQWLEARTGVAEAARAMDARARAMEDAVATSEESQDSMRAIEAYTESVERYSSLGGEDLEARAAEVLHDLGLDESALARPLGSLSGGQRSRAHLAGLLLARFDIFLLDEPTNDLDFAGLDRLERFVGSSPAGMMVVSHDRFFLQSCVTSVLELDGVTGEASEFAGGYDAYVRERRTAREAEWAAYERYQSERKRLLEDARRRKTWAASGAARAKRRPSDPDKFIKAGRIEGAENSAAKAKIVERQIERLEVAEKPWESWRLALSFGDAPRASYIVSRLESAVLERGAFRMGPLDVDIRWGDRVLITGANGSGKTTLLAALIGELPLAAGRRRLGPDIRIGVMDQNRDAFDDEVPWLEVFIEQSGLLEEDARSLLAKFALAADHVARPANSLSPGERSRANLALLAARAANCLVLDEPTNHLDLEAIEQLEGALTEFSGTVILVSHDRRLIEAFAPTHRIEL
jgi:ATPase subunit of ABC transporter with duplicated ATPase domains